MTPKTKQILTIIGAIAVISVPVGLIIYFSNKKSDDEQKSNFGLQGIELRDLNVKK